jgi:hypothetical protein
MMLEISSSRKRELLHAGYHLALEYKDGNKKVWPDDPPEMKSNIVLVPNDTRQAQEFFVSSTRGITLGREISGGPMGNRWGIVCAEDDRGRNQFVVGGGKRQPDWDTEASDRLLPGEDRELVRGAMVAENREELRIHFGFSCPDGLTSPEYRDDMMHERYFLFGLRVITEKVEVEGGRPRYDYKRDEATALPFADAAFLAICHERLNYFSGQKGETRTRHVKPASELLRQITREERSKGVLPVLPLSHALVLAMAIRSAKKIFGADCPPPLQEVIKEGEEAAEKVISGSHYSRYFLECFQAVPWRWEE